MKKEKFHLEISPRCSGKSHRIVQKIIEVQKLDPNYRSGICCPSSRMSKILLQKINELGGDMTRVFTFSNISEMNQNKNGDTHLFFDDFIWTGWITLENIEQIVNNFHFYFSSSSSGKTPLEDFTPENSLLAKLIQLNNGFILSYHSFDSAQHQFPSYLDEVRNTLAKNQFDQEYLAHYLK